MLKRRLSTPRAAIVIALAAVLAAAVAVAPSFATPSFLTTQKAAHTYVTNKKASKAIFLKKKAAGNLYVQKPTAPLTPVVGIAAGTTQYGPVNTTTAGYIPTAFTSFAAKNTAPAVITFSGNATCTGRSTDRGPRLPDRRSWSTARRPGKSTSRPATGELADPGPRGPLGDRRPPCSARAATPWRSSTSAPKA